MTIKEENATTKFGAVDREKSIEKYFIGLYGKIRELRI
jgi:hypothetical protein